MEKFLFLLSVLILIGISIFATETLVIRGSNTIFPIVQLWIEELRKIYDIRITLEGAGSSTGIANQVLGMDDTIDQINRDIENEVYQIGRYTPLSKD